MKNGTPLWREARFEVRMYKTPHGRTRCGAKHICQSKCAKHRGRGPIFEGRPQITRHCGAKRVFAYKTPAFWSILKGF